MATLVTEVFLDFSQRERAEKELPEAVNARRNSPVTNNSSFRNYPYSEDHTIRTTDTPGLRQLTMLTLFTNLTSVHFSYCSLRSESIAGTIVFGNVTKILPISS